MKTSKITRFMDRHMKIIYMTPCILFLIVMVVFPLLYTFRLSFFDWGMSTVAEPEFIGLKNYSELLHDQYFISSIWITQKYSLISVILEVLIGIILALMLNCRKLFMRNVFKTVMLIPMSMTPVAVGMIWKLLMDPSIGLFNYGLKLMGLPASEWIFGSTTVIRSLIMIDVWEWSPMVALIVLAGLSGIDEDIYEAATMDGAGYLQKTFRITLPLSLNVILVATLLRLIDALKTFDIIYSTTQGGPAFQSQTINIYSYLYGFQYYKYGYASASMILFLMLVLVVTGIVMYIRTKVVVDR